MILKALSRFAVIVSFLFVILMILIHQLSTREDLCDPNNIFVNHPKGRTAIVRLCIDQKHLSFTLSTDGDIFIPVPLQGSMWGAPIWSPDEQLFGFTLRSKWGQFIVYRYFIYDINAQKVSFLYKSQKNYGLVWNEKGTLLLARLDDSYLCYRYFTVSAQNSLEEVKVDTLPLEIQCAETVCMNISRSAYNCQT